MTEIEIETTYLALALPEGLAKAKHRKLVDVYFPAQAVHPQMRIRQQGEDFVLTKKTQVKADDASMQTEENIVLTQGEFEALRAGQGKLVAKTRYYVPVGDRIAEVDVFEGALAGLVLVDVEFTSEETRDAFVKPSFCGADVTQEVFIAGGMLAGKSLADIQTDLDRLGYQPVDLTAIA